MRPQRLRYREKTWLVRNRKIYRSCYEAEFVHVVMQSARNSRVVVALYLDRRSQNHPKESSCTLVSRFANTEGIVPVSSYDYASIAGEMQVPEHVTRR